MKHLSVTINHDLGAQEACRRLQEGFGRIREQLQIIPGGALTVSDHWEGNLMRFEGQALGSRVAGRLTVLDKTVHIELDVPDLIGFFASKLRGSLEKETRLLLGNHPRVESS
jgi:hypothetical protein